MTGMAGFMAFIDVSQKSHKYELQFKTTLIDNS